MMGRALAAVAVALAALATTGDPVAAQAVERAGAQKDWSVFASGEGDERVCWVMTRPKSWRAERDGRTVEANRGDIYIMVAVRPAYDVDNEVSWVSGYPLREDSVRLDIGGQGFAMPVVKNEGDGGFAWPLDASQDERIVDAMRRGLEATVTGVSTRGTKTTDTFSLIGFSAALGDAQRLCG